MEKLKIELNEVFSLNETLGSEELNCILCKHADLFKECHISMKGIKAHIWIHEGASPFYFLSHTLSCIHVLEEYFHVLPSLHMSSLLLSCQNFLLHFRFLGTCAMYARLPMWMAGNLMQPVLVTKLHYTCGRIYFLCFTSDNM